MQIGRRNILGKLYRFNFDFIPGDYFESRTDLCHFLRVVFIWLPLKFFIIGFLVFLGTMGLIFIPLLEWGPLLYLNILAIIVAIGFLIIRLIGGYEARGPGASSIELLTYYYKAIKQRVCPIIEIEDD